MKIKFLDQDGTLHDDLEQRKKSNESVLDIILNEWLFQLASALCFFA